MNFKKFLLRLTLFVVVCVVVLVGLLFGLYFSAQNNEFQKTSKGKVDLNSEGVVMHKGNVNGIPIAVPDNYFKFPFEYKDKSIWEKPKPGDKTNEQRGYEDAVGSFAIYVRWPDMEPRNRDTEKSFWASRTKPGEHSWLLIALNDRYVMSPRPPKSLDNGLARVLRGRIDRITERYVQAPGVHYVMRGVDPSTDLKWAEPVGLNTDRFHTWNMVNYWKGDMNGVVTDLIECYNGRMPNPNAYHVCTYTFALPEWNAYMIISHPRSWLPKWRSLKMKAKKLMLGFQFDAGNNKLNIKKNSIKENE